jgi:hypothetical protein
MRVRDGGAACRARGRQRRRRSAHAVWRRGLLPRNSSTPWGRAGGHGGASSTRDPLPRRARRAECARRVGPPPPGPRARDPDARIRPRPRPGSRSAGGAAAGLRAPAARPRAGAGGGPSLRRPRARPPAARLARLRPRAAEPVGPALRAAPRRPARPRGREAGPEKHGPGAVRGPVGRAAPARRQPSSTARAHGAPSPPTPLARGGRRIRPAMNRGNWSNTAALIRATSRAAAAAAAARPPRGPLAVARGRARRPGVADRSCAATVVPAASLRRGRGSQRVRARGAEALLATVLDAAVGAYRRPAALLAF